MGISAEDLLLIPLVGLTAGLLASQIMQHEGFALAGDLVNGVAGAILGSWLLPQLGVLAYAGITAATINGTAGALALLLLAGLLRSLGGLARDWLGRGPRRPPAADLSRGNER
ncbi:MAG TPA: hypothetical protein VMM59_04955 [Thermohalobaculum sp.]|nr:hypothetical protein [Thermohalobaculum sp.]